MSMDTYVKCLQNLPGQCIVKFCGFAEPFLNPLCIDMICKAYEQGKSIELFTTLVGLDEKGLKRIWDIPMETVVVHVPDEKEYAKIPITDEYTKILKMILEHKKRTGLHLLICVMLKQHRLNKLRIFVEWQGMKY